MILFWKQLSDRLGIHELQDDELSWVGPPFTKYVANIGLFGLTFVMVICPGVLGRCLRCQTPSRGFQTSCSPSSLYIRRHGELLVAWRGPMSCCFRCKDWRLWESPALPNCRLVFSVRTCVFAWALTRMVSGLSTASGRHADVTSRSSWFNWSGCQAFSFELEVASHRTMLYMVTTRMWYICIYIDIYLLQWLYISVKSSIYELASESVTLLKKFHDNRAWRFHDLVSRFFCFGQPVLRWVEWCGDVMWSWNLRTCTWYILYASRMRLSLVFAKYHDLASQASHFNIFAFATQTWYISTKGFCRVSILLQGHKLRDNTSYDTWSFWNAKGFFAKTGEPHSYEIAKFNQMAHKNSKSNSKVEWDLNIPSVKYMWIKRETGGPVSFTPLAGSWTALWAYLIDHGGKTSELPNIPCLASRHVRAVLL